MSRRERRALALAGAALLLGAVVVVVLVLASRSSSSRPAFTVSEPAASRFPAPPHGAVVYAREDGANALALAVLRRADGVGLQASVVGGAGTGVTGLHVSFGVMSRNGTASAAAAPCGPGCYRANVRTTSQPRLIRVRVGSPGRTTTWNVPLPKTWPPADASAIVARATRVWKQLRTLRYIDRLGSDPTHVVVTRWQIVAPDRLAYQIRNGSQSIIVGLRRWDRPSEGGAWESSAALRLHQPQPFWVSATDAHVLGSGSFGGRPVWRISFYDPRTPAWFLVSIDKRTLRTLDLHMIANAHFMHDRYGPFNAPTKIVPPKS